MLAPAYASASFRCECREAATLDGVNKVHLPKVSMVAFPTPSVSSAMRLDHRRRRWRSNSGLPLVSQYGQVRTVHLNTFVGRGTRESHTLCPPRGGCEKPPRESDGT